MTEPVIQPGFGPHLKAAREAGELSVAKVAEKLKLTPRQIEALEEEDLSQLPSAVFVRGFIRNYARLLEIDPESLIPPVDAEAAVSETITAPSEGVHFATSGVKRWVVLPLLALAGFFVLVALLYHWLRQGEDALLTAPPVAAQPEVVQALPPPAAILPPVTPAPAQPPLSVPDQAPAQPPLPAAVPTTPAPSVPTPVPGSATSPTPAPPPQTSAAPVPSAPAAAVAADAPQGKHNLRFEPGTDAWIQVVDAKGQHFSRLVRAGSVEVFAGETPFRLVVGEAAQVRLTFDGHKIDLTPFIGQKVARLTLE